MLGNLNDTTSRNNIITPVSAGVIIPSGSVGTQTSTKEPHANRRVSSSTEQYPSTFPALLATERNTEYWAHPK